MLKVTFNLRKICSQRNVLFFQDFALADEIHYFTGQVKYILCLLAYLFTYVYTFVFFDYSSMFSFLNYLVFSVLKKNFFFDITK